MKILILGSMLCFTMVARANVCSIDFENEISANRETHHLYKYIRNNRAILKAKGFKLVSANTENSQFEGFMTIDDSGHFLELQIFENNSSKEWSKTVPMAKKQIAVLKLLKMLPRCREFMN